jgi:hypothetical protein
MDHCGNQTDGPGIADTGIDPLTALEQWVEQGQAPNELIATKMAPTGNQTLWRRPVCAYPKIARYRGSGDPTDPSSFACAAMRLGDVIEGRRAALLGQQRPWRARRIRRTKRPSSQRMVGR